MASSIFVDGNVVEMRPKPMRDLKALAIIDTDFPTASAST
jgi:hypothetical protein